MAYAPTTVSEYTEISPRYRRGASEATEVLTTVTENAKLSSWVPPSGSAAIKALDWTDYIESNDARWIGGGGFGDVYEVQWSRQPLGSECPPRIVIKKFRISFTNQAETWKTMKKILREIAVWHVLKHPNVVPFVGIYQPPLGPPSLISEWMSNSSAKDYIQKHEEPVCLLMIILGIARGLEYLHISFPGKPTIVHGDMKAENVLINRKGESCVCDFGLSHMLVDNTLWNTSARQAGGTLRWMAPELLSTNDEDEEEAAIPATATVSSDMYAYGMTCYEIMRGLVPFHKKGQDHQVLLAVMSGNERPKRDADCITDAIWILLESCWVRNPTERQSTSEVIKVLKVHDCKSIISSSDSPPCIHPDEWWGKPKPKT